jgi:hypothetical protein
VKKVNKNSLPLRENSLPLRGLFCGQTASSLRPYGRSGQIICIGEFFYIIGFKTLENGGVGPLQISKKQPQSSQNAHRTQKSQISYILKT